LDETELKQKKIIALGVSLLHSICTYFFVFY